MPGLHVDRVAGGDRHHRHPDRPAAARRPKGPRGRRPHASARTTSSRSGSPATAPTIPTASCRRATASSPRDQHDRHAVQHGSLFYFLLPFLEQSAVYQATTGYSYTSTAVVKVFLAPLDPSVTGTKTAPNSAGVNAASAVTRRTAISSPATPTPSAISWETARPRTETRPTA